MRQPYAVTDVYLQLRRQVLNRQLLTVSIAPCRPATLVPATRQTFVADDVRSNPRTELKMQPRIAFRGKIRGRGHSQRFEPAVSGKPRRAERLTASHNRITHAAWPPMARQARRSRARPSQFPRAAPPELSSHLYLPDVSSVRHGRLHRQSPSHCGRLWPFRA